MTTRTNTTATINAATRSALVTENNALGLREYDLVKTVGKGIGIVLRKKSLNDELVIYSISSASETHPTDDDGMAKVRRYNADGTIATTSETTGRRLRNREIYTITGIKSYTNPVLAMKDFINQNTDIVFDAVGVEETNNGVNTDDVATLSQIMTMFEDIKTKLDEIRNLV